MVFVLLGVLLIAALAAKALFGVYRGCEPNIVDVYDAHDRATAFELEEREELARSEFVDKGVHLVRAGKAEMVMHLYQRASDGTVVTGLSQPDGSLPAHYVSTLLAEGRGWLDTRRTDRMPGPRGQLFQVLPDSSLGEMVASHTRALRVLGDHGMATVRRVKAFGLHMHQATLTKRSLRHNPIRWLIRLASRSLNPDVARDITGGAQLSRQLSAMGLT